MSEEEFLLQLKSLRLPSMLIYSKIMNFPIISNESHRSPYVGENSIFCYRISHFFVCQDDK